MVSTKISWHIKTLWHAMTNVGAINSRHTKIYGVQKVMDCHENL
jgi:hypothetical protein